MEHGTLEREIHIDAPPDVVFDVVSRPEHLRQWWPDEADLDPRPGATGEIVFGHRADGGQVAVLTVVDVDPPKEFSFRWVYPEGEVPVTGNSLLVRFELVPAGEGTLLRLTETGFREKGWESAVLEQQYREHESGWDHFLPRLALYAPTVGVAR